ncbi:MAG: hypothetical protein RL754_45 [Bacteroidota bacterium]|jgi:type III pantothenate kinase
MDLVAVDFGNTTIKVGLFKQGLLKHELRFALDQELEARNRVAFWMEENQTGALGLKSGAPDPKLWGLLDVRWLAAEENWPINIDYKTPETLGIDRLALSAAAFLEHQCDLLLITVGTCITYNVIKDGSFMGGAISPGWDMRYKAMHAFTAGLPEVERDENPSLLGQSTVGSLNAGVDIALPLEMSGMIDSYTSAFLLKKVIICGGNTNALVSPLKKHIFAPLNYELYALERLNQYFKNQSLSK